MMDKGYKLLVEGSQLDYLDLVGLRLPGTNDDGIVWQAEAQLSIRGLPIPMQDRVAAHYCPVLLDHPPDEKSADRPVPLVTTFLSTETECAGR